MSDNEFLIAGLGNPGEQYVRNRHNIGFMIVDELAARWGHQLRVEKWNGNSCRISQWGVRLSLVKPMTYMNRSGNSVAEFARFYKIPTSRIVVIHDDLDMHPGRLKLVCGGGAGGHNGIRSLSQTLGDGSYYRLKFGIGRPGQGGVHPDFPVDKYVLSDFGADELNYLQQRIDIIEEGLQLFIEQSPVKAMNIINSVK